MKLVVNNNFGNGISRFTSTRIKKASSSFLLLYVGINSVQTRRDAKMQCRAKIMARATRDSFFLIGLLRCLSWVLLIARLLDLALFAHCSSAGTAQPDGTALYCIVGRARFLFCLRIDSFPFFSSPLLRPVAMGVLVGRFPWGACQKRVPKGKDFFKNSIRKGAGQAFSLGRWEPRDGPSFSLY